jgi:GMP reductase
MLTNLEEKYDYSDVLIVPNESDIRSRSEVNLTRDFSFKWSTQKRSGIGIVAANMDTVGTLSMARAMSDFGLFTALHKHITIRDYLSLGVTERAMVFFTIGVQAWDIERLKILVADGNAPGMVCIDIANGHLSILDDAIRQVRALIPDAVIMAGNVVTAHRAVEIIMAGADIVKVGIGPGSACTTRKQTGVGYPQLSAVYECARAVDEVGGMVCADGGCTVPGDVGKAFIAGADFVMLGGMLAGTDESGGHILLHSKVPSKSVKVVQYAGRDCYQFQQSTYYDLHSLPDEAWDTVTLDEPKMLFYGMSSDTAMDKYSGGVAEYRSSEGRTVLIPYKGKVKRVVIDLLGGLRSTMTYIGCTDIANIAYSATFVKTRRQLNTVFAK